MFHIQAAHRGSWPHSRPKGKRCRSLGSSREQWSRHVDQDLLSGFWLCLVAGSFDKLAAGEGGSGAYHGDEVGGVDHAPVVLG